MDEAGVVGAVVDVQEAVEVEEAAVADRRSWVVGVVGVEEVGVEEVKQRQEEKMEVAGIVEKDEEVKQRQEKKLVVAGIVEKDEVVVE